MSITSLEEYHKKSDFTKPEIWDMDAFMGKNRHDV